MQSAVIIDLPKNCRECPIKQIKVLGHTPVYACLLSKKLIIGEGTLNCPLVPLPERRIGEDEYSRGFNECLETITHN